MTSWPLLIGRSGTEILDRPVALDDVAAGSVAPRRSLRALVTGPRVRRVMPLVLVLVAGATLRLWRIGAVGFNSDEAVYAGQAAGIVGDPELSHLFPVFRAHPLLFQSLLSLTYLGGVDDVLGRVLVVAFGVATIAVVHLLGRLLYGRTVGLVAAALVALMPYHIDVTRQVLLDGPMLFFATAALYFTARYCRESDARWLYAAGIAMGLAFLTKETSIILVGGLFIFFVLSHSVRVRRRDALIALGLTTVLAAALPVSLAFSGRTSTGRSYFGWQLFRPANHDLWFYPSTIPPAITVPVLALAVAGLWFLRRRATWREPLLVCWAAVPVAFFEIWPVKGYQYLLVVVPVVAVLAARVLVELPIPRFTSPSVVDVARGVAMAAVFLSMLVPASFRVNPQPSTTFLAGSGGLPAGREVGEWIDANLPEGSRILTLGPSMANVVRFYGHRPAFGLSVSPNPASRNPSYQPVENPDRQLREGDLPYLVWDAYTAERSPFFAERLRRYVEKYNGVALHTETIDVETADGTTVAKPVIVVYEVQP